MTDTFPRLLFLSGAVPETRPAGGLLLYRMLQGYPADRVLSVGPRTHPQSTLLSSEYRYLPGAPSSRLDLTRFAELKRSLQSIGLVGKIPMSRIDEAVGAFAPDVVLCVMERRDYVDAAQRFCEARRLPLVLIIHDRLEWFDLVYPPFKRAQLSQNGESYRFASARLCVSPEMAACLEKVYGAPGTVLYPIRSDDLEARPAAASANLVAPPAVTIAYCGGLGYGYGQRIREAAPALVRGGARIRIYSRDRIEDWPEGVTYVGAIASPAELWTRVKQECDAVWLPYSFDSHHQALYSTHFPSKLTEYVALGMPVLITGPGYATGVKWGLAHPSAALTMADESTAALEAAARRMRDEPSLRVSLATHARGGDQEFDPRAIRRQFVEIVRSVAA
jgi:glycosyltransferase involved in cell wall biosynthesis